MQFFDTHAHLNLPPLSEDPSQIIQNASSAGVDYILVPSCDQKTANLAIQLATENKNIFAAVGIHPGSTSEIDATEIQTIQKLTTNQNLSAIGEIGLDYFHEKTEEGKEIQKKIFRTQLEIANQQNLPVIIHARDAHTDTVKILQEYEIKHAVFHCFSGTVTQMEEIISNGWHISFTGIITYPKADETRKCVSKIPQDRFFLETDCPYLAPQSVRGQTNEPKHIPEIAQKVAEIRNEDLAQVAEYTTQNSLNFFQKKA